MKVTFRTVDTHRPETLPSLGGFCILRGNGGDFWLDRVHVDRRAWVWRNEPCSDVVDGDQYMELDEDEIEGMWRTVDTKDRAALPGEGGWLLLRIQEGGGCSWHVGWLETCGAVDEDDDGQERDVEIFTWRDSWTNIREEYYGGYNMELAVQAGDMYIPLEMEGAVDV
jgi:hypothetical protein